MSLMLPWWNSGAVYAQDLDAGDYIFYLQYSKNMNMQAAVISYAKKECAPIEGQKCETFTGLAQGSEKKHDDNDKEDNKKKDEDKKEEKKDVTPKKHDDDQDKEEKDKNSGGGGKKKTKDEKEEGDIDGLVPKKEDLSKEANSLREMIIQLLKLIEEVDKKQTVMKGKDANLAKTKEELEAKVAELQKKLKAIND